MNKNRVPFFERKRTGIFMSIVSLIIIISLLTVTTYSWLENSTEADIETDSSISFDVTPDLDITSDNVTDGKIEINNFVLREVSSVDGRNVYVPDDSFYSDGDNRTTTKELRFREANPADVYDGKKGTTPSSNMRYVAFSFYISSPSGVDTDVYLSSSSKISGTGADYVRMSIDTHDGNAPKVFSSSASVGYPVYTDAVSAIKSSGEYKDLSSQKAEAFATYSYSGEANALFTIEANKKKFVTITLWLEGASGDFPDEISGTDISANINIKTTQDYVNTIKVVDRTLDNWVYNRNSYLFVYDAGSSDDTNYKMEYDESAKAWTAKIPQEVENIYIRRGNPDDKNIKWNSWGSKTYPINVPGANNFNINSSEAEKETGLSLTYNILGTDEIEGIDSYDEYEAGIWGDLPDSAFDEVHFFDQSSSSSSDTKGYFNWDASTIPVVNMSVTYNYYNNYENTEVTTNIRYRLFREYVGTRLFHNTQFVGAEGYTINSVKYVDYTKFDYQKADDDDEAGALKNAKIGSKSISAQSGYCSSGKRFFAYTGGSSGYWGTGMNYVVTNGDVYTNDNSAGAKYVMYFFTGTSSGSWRDMCRWGDEYTKYNKHSFPGSNESFYAVVNPGNTSAIYCRMKYGSTNYSFDNNDELWNRTDNCDISTNKDCNVTGLGGTAIYGKSPLNIKSASDWKNLPDRPEK